LSFCWSVAAVVVVAELTTQTHTAAVVLAVSSQAQASSAKRPTPSRSEAAAQVLRIMVLLGCKELHRHLSVRQTVVDLLRVGKVSMD